MLVFVEITSLLDFRRARGAILPRRMAGTRWDERFFSTTRGRIVLLVRRAARTVDDLAGLLDVTANAVRAQLLVLERDGLVQQRGVRRGPGKPAYLYELTPQAERLFPKAYGPVLRTLLDVLRAQLPGDMLEAACREVGRRLAAERGAPPGDLHERLAATATLLEDMGGLVEVETSGDRVRLGGRGCPLAALVPDHPEACRLVEALVADMTGVPVRQRCETGPPPRCRFELAASGDGAR
jgi:predicted ArsR family transcriptional regulator